MIEEATIQNWPNGANNRSPSDRIPEGFVRDLVNLHPIGGKLRLRPGAETVLSGASVRHAHAYKDGLLVVDGEDLAMVDPSMSSRSIGAVPGTGPCAFTTMDGTVYASVGDRVFTVKAGAVSAWGYQTPLGVASNATESQRKVAVTFSDLDGVEGGASPAIPLGDMVTVPAPPAGCVANIYASAENGDEMYFQQAVAGAGTYAVPQTSEESRVLTLQYVTQPPPAELLTNHQSMVFGAAGNLVYYTSPMQPHHVDPMENFFFFPSPVSSLAAGKAGVYIGADKLYLLTFRGDEARQETVSEYAPMDGALYETDKGNVVAMTRKGLLIEQSDSRGGWLMAPVTEAAYDVVDHSAAALGEVDYEGEKLIVSSVKDRRSTGSGLSASDFFETEVVRP